MLCACCAQLLALRRRKCSAVRLLLNHTDAQEHVHHLKMPPKRVFPRQESLLLPAVVNPFRLDSKLSKCDKIKVSAAFAYSLYPYFRNICPGMETHGWYEV